MPDTLLRLTKPLRSSDEGLPLANGLLGALVWGDGRPLNISLDRTDLWDLRDVPEFHAADYRWADVVEKHCAGAHDELIARLEQPYYRPGPTKIPAGRIELAIDGAFFAEATLDPALPIGLVELGDSRVQVLVHATRRVGMIRVEGHPCQFRLRPPAFGGKPDDWVPPAGFDASHADVWELGYAPPTHYNGATSEAFVQHGHGDFMFAVYLEWRPSGTGTLAAWSIATSSDGPDPLTLA